MRHFRGILLILCICAFTTAACADTESFTIGKPGDFTSVFQVLDGNTATTDFFLLDSNFDQWGGQAAGSAASVSASFNLDTGMNTVGSQGSVMFLLNVDGTIAATVTDSNGTTIVGFGYDSLAINLFESGFSPIQPANMLGWMDAFGYHPSGFAAGAIPEPGSLLLLGTGVLGVIGAFRRRLM